MSVDSGVGGQSSTSSNASINNASVSSGHLTPKGDANSTTALVNLNSNASVHSKTSGLEKAINDIRITENPISESPELAAAADGTTTENPVC